MAVMSHRVSPRTFWLRSACHIGSNVPYRGRAGSLGSRSVGLVPGVRRIPEQVHVKKPSMVLRNGADIVCDLLGKSTNTTHVVLPHDRRLTLAPLTQALGSSTPINER
jgi:hypothetical protein